MEQEKLERISQVLHRFCRTFQIPITLLDCTQQQPYFSSVTFDPDPAQFYLGTALDKTSEDPQILQRNEITCGFVRLHDCSYAVLVGPVATNSCQDRHYTAILKEMGLSLTRKGELRRWLNKIPTMDRAHFVSLLTFFSTLFNGTESSIKDVDQIEIEDTRTPEFLIKMGNIVHNTYSLEKDILHAITAGDSALLSSILPGVQGMDAAAGEFTGDAVRTMKNLFIIAATLCSRAAVAGGMDYDQALTLSDNYIDHVETLRRAEDIVPQIGMMMYEYCEQVERLRQPQECSPLTMKIISDVHAHLHQPVSVEEIARRCNLSVSYITHTFSKEMKQSLKSYIQQQKMEEAKRLLRSSSHSIAETASILGFSSQAHFQSTFRRVVGITPLAYRKET